MMKENPHSEKKIHLVRFDLDRDTYIKVKRLAVDLEEKGIGDGDMNTTYLYLLCKATGMNYNPFKTIKHGDKHTMLRMPKEVALISKHESDKDSGITYAEFISRAITEEVNKFNDPNFQLPKTAIENLTGISATYEQKDEKVYLKSIIGEDGIEYRLLTANEYADHCGMTRQAVDWNIRMGRLKMLYIHDNHARFVMVPVSEFDKLGE